MKMINDTMLKDIVPFNEQTKVYEHVNGINTNVKRQYNYKMNY